MTCQSVPHDGQPHDGDVVRVWAVCGRGHVRNGALCASCMGPGATACTECGTPRVFIREISGAPAVAVQPPTSAPGAAEHYYSIVEEAAGAVLRDRMTAVVETARASERERIRQLAVHHRASVPGAGSGSRRAFAALIGSR